jgi:hypothetical protein
MEANMCIALTSKQKRCKNRVRSGLFCHCHRSKAESKQDDNNHISSNELNICLGITTKNKRCKNRTNILDSLYCHYHISQKQEESTVEGIRSTYAHSVENEEKIIVCMGITSKKQRCKIIVRNGQNYCHHHQQGKLMASFFRHADNRQALYQVLALREYKDIYTGILISEASLLELDHIVELHFIASAWNEMSSAIENHRVGVFLVFLRQQVNNIMNLNLTSRKLNFAKFRAFKNFESSHNQEDGIFPFMIQEGIHPIIIYNICQSIVLVQQYLQSFDVPQQFYQYTKLWRDIMNAKFHKMKLK